LLLKNNRIALIGTLITGHLIGGCLIEVGLYYILVAVADLWEGSLLFWVKKEIPEEREPGRASKTKLPPPRPL